MALEFPRQALHAREIRFVHPASGKTMVFSSDCPPDMAELVETLQICRAAMR